MTNKLVPLSKLSTSLQSHSTNPIPTFKHIARIYKPSKSVMQSSSNSNWIIDFDTKAKWINPLIGWTSSNDAVQALHLEFNTKDEAIMRAEREGWEYTVIEEEERKFKKKSYADNYKYSSGKLRQIKTK